MNHLSAKGKVLREKVSLKILARAKLAKKGLKVTFLLLDFFCFHVVKPVMPIYY